MNKNFLFMFITLCGLQLAHAQMQHEVEGKSKVTANFNILNIESTSTKGWIDLANTNGSRGYIGMFYDANDVDFGTNTSNGKAHLVTQTMPRLTVIPNGNVGIGVTDPDAKLEVDGQIKITGGSPGLDKVLVSDANGLASWGAPPAPPAPTYAVGDFAHGGVVFWVSPSGEHGKVVSIYDVDNVKWSNIATIAIGNTVRSDLYGAGNTVGIMMQTGHIHSAAKHCADLAYSGYDDWYLPSKDELNEIWLNKTSINTTALAHGGEGLAVGFWLYWSSTEDSNFAAWYQNLDSGGQNSTNKDYEYRIRAVRAF